MRSKAGVLSELGYRLRIDLTDTQESILLHATGPAAQIELTDQNAEAATVLRLTVADMEKLITGRLSPMVAFSTGRLRIEGSKGVALKLASLFDND